MSAFDAVPSPLAHDVESDAVPNLVPAHLVLVPRVAELVEDVAVPAEAAAASSEQPTESSEPERMVRLVSQDGEEFRVPVSVAARMGEVVQGMIGDPDDEESETVIPLPDKHCTGKVVAQMVAYCTHYQTEPMTPFSDEIVPPNKAPVNPKHLASRDLRENGVQPFYADFISRLSNPELYNLTMAVNYLGNPPLLDLCAACLTSKIKDQTPEQMVANLSMGGDAGATTSVVAPTDTSA